jgi:drug/metabolite transporter (DMT)-like permease
MQAATEEESARQGIAADISQYQGTSSLSRPDMEGLSEDGSVKNSGISLARGVLLTCAALYGTNFASVKMLDEAMAPSMAAFLRFTLAALVFAPPMLQKGLKNPALMFGGLEVGFYVWVGYVMQAISLQTTSASVAAFICSLSVIVVPLLDVFFPNHQAQVETSPASSQSDSFAKMAFAFNPMLAKHADHPVAVLIEKAVGLFSSKKFAALWPALIAATGVACLELGGTSAPGMGDLWAFGQPLMFGLGFWRAEHYMRQLKDGEAPAFTGAMLATVALCSLVWTAQDWAYPVVHSAVTQHRDAATAIFGEVAKLKPLLQDWHVLASLLWTGVFTTALTTFGENYAMKSLSSSETTVIFSTEPLWGTAFAAATLGEPIGPNTFAGAALIMIACMWGSLGSLGPMLIVGESAADESIVGTVMENAQDLIETITSTGLPPDDFIP